MTSLPEDVFALAGVQIRTIRERLTKKSVVLVDAVVMIFTAMQLKQRSSRNDFLVDLETCCAAANDFVRMTDMCDEIVDDLLENTNLSSQDQTTLQEVANELMRQYTNDAVYAAQSIHKYIFDPIQEDLSDKLFSQEWEEMTNNEFALTIVRTVEDFMSDVEEWMEEVMVRKLVDGLVKAAINFYIKQLLLKAGKKKGGSFSDPQRALDRINGDVKSIRSYFENMTDTFPALQRVINEEFDVMKTMFALFWLVANDGEEPENYFPSIQKSVKNVDICRFVIGDFYHLIAPDKEREFYELFEKHEMELRALEVKDSYVEEHLVDKSLSLEHIVVSVVGESKRRRPIKGEALKSMERAFGKWGWKAGGDTVDEEGPEIGE